jgi:hypothetical protein
MSITPKVTIINATTGETITRDFNNDELEQLEKDIAEAAQREAEAQAKAEAKAAAEVKLKALGLTTDDLKALGL